MKMVPKYQKNDVQQQKTMKLAVLAGFQPKFGQKMAKIVIFRQKLAQKWPKIGILGPKLAKNGHFCQKMMIFGLE